MTTSVSASELKAIIGSGDEVAILDVRDQGDFGERHLLFSSCLPLNRLELQLRRLVPRYTARIVLVDDDNGLAARAAQKLEGFGYRDLSILKGGVSAWQQAGYEVFSGVSVPSKAFGEFVEQVDETPHLTAEELYAKRAAGENIVVLDSRPFEEFINMTIPGAINLPGAELAYRVRTVVPDPETEIVVNCAGRTRSIIGAQSLINAGIPNRVSALQNGTMGWHLAGYELEKGAIRRAPSVHASSFGRVRAMAERVADRFGVESIDRQTLNRWIDEADRRSLFLLDVRTDEEYRGGHLPGSVHAPGGQLVQNTDAFIGTLNARVVLIDDARIRATMTASWLRQMGWRESVVLDDDLGSIDLVTGDPVEEVPGLEQTGVQSISALDLKRKLDAAAATVVDLSLSPAYRAGHIPGARFAVRANLAARLAELPMTEWLVLTCEDGRLSRLAAQEIDIDCEVRVLDGGMAAWRNLGLPRATGFEEGIPNPGDCYPRPYDRDSSVEKAMQEYLDWEIALVEGVNRDGDARFDIIRPK